MKKQGSCLEKEIMQGTMPGARRRGRPRTAWMDNIKTWTGLPVEESVRMTADRDKWRKRRTAGREGAGKGNEKTKGMRKAREGEEEREGRGVEGICRTNVKLLPTHLESTSTVWTTLGVRKAKEQNSARMLSIMQCEDEYLQ